MADKLVEKYVDDIADSYKNPVLSCLQISKKQLVKILINFKQDLKKQLIDEFPKKMDYRAGYYEQGQVECLNEVKQAIEKFFGGG